MNTKALLLAACILVSVGCDVADNVTGVGAGLLTVNVTTSGANADPDGYLLSITGEPDELLAVNDTRTFSVATTNVTVELSDIAVNCTVAGNPVNVDVNLTTTVAFLVECS